MGYHSKSLKNSKISIFILKKRKKKKKDVIIYSICPCVETDPRLYRWIVEPVELLK
jgi:hypothetical protein